MSFITKIFLINYNIINFFLLLLKDKDRIFS